MPTYRRASGPGLLCAPAREDAADPHLVLISPEWIKEVSWLKSEVSIDLDRQAIKESPLYDEATPLERESEGALYRHYGRSSYWREPPDQAAA